MKLFAMLEQTQRTAPMKWDYSNMQSTSSTQRARASPLRVMKAALVYQNSSSITAQTMPSTFMRLKVQWAQVSLVTKLEDTFLTLLVQVFLCSLIL
jgi:hypothetical protein